MQRQFNLTLTSRWKATVLILAIVFAFLPLMVGMVEIFIRSPWLGAVGEAAVVIAFVFLPEIIARKFSAESVVVTIDDMGLTVQYPALATARHLNFAEIAAYYADLNRDFNVQPRRGTKLTLHLNTKFHPQGWGPLLAMQQHFELAVADYQRRNPNSPAIRKLGFFNRRVATVWLVAFATLLAWLGWRAFQPLASEGTWGGFLFAGLLFTIYALTWQHHRKQPA